MAIARLIAPFASISGKIEAPGGQSPVGALVAMPDANGRTLTRSYVIPANPGSIFQTEIRSYMTSIAEALQTVSLAQVDAWRAIADVIVRSGRLGLNYRLTWNQLFSQVNNYQLMEGNSISFDPPAVDSSNIPAGFTSITSDDGDPIQEIQVTMAESVAPTAGSRIFFQFTRNLGSTSRSARDNEFQGVEGLGDMIKARVGTPFRYTFDSTRLNLLPGMRVGVKATIITANGYPAGTIFNRNILITPAG